MKLLFKTNIEDSLVCKFDDKNYKYITLKNNPKIIIPENAEKVEICHDDSDKKSIMGFAFLSILCSFFESQKTFEKREFISFYNFAENCLISDFYFTNKNGNDEVTVSLKEKNYGKFKCLLWYSNDMQINNYFSKKVLRRSLIELISFWSVVLLIPSAVILGVILAAYIKSNSIFELGIFLLFFFLSFYIGNIICFIFQYKKVLAGLKEIMK